MTQDEFDRDLGSVLRVMAGGDASPALRARLARITDTPAVSAGLRFSWPLRLGAVAVLAVALVTLAVVLSPEHNVGPAPISSESPTAQPSSTVAPTPTPTLTVAPTVAPTPEPTNATHEPTPTAAAWTGIEWSGGVVSFPNQQGTSSGQVLTDVAISDVVAWRGGYVAGGWMQETTFGCDLIEGCTNRPAHAAFFTSNDGLHWSVAQEQTAQPETTVQFVVPVGNGLVAMGREHLWYSGDGTTWTAIDSPSWRDLWQISNGPAPVLLAVASGSSGVVAVGNTQLGVGEAGEPVIAYSADGRTWTAANLPTAPAMVRDVVAYRGGFVIAGRDGEPDVFGGGACCTNGGYIPGTGRPAAWTSTDGVTWASASVEGSVVPGGELEEVLVGAGGFFAVGINTQTGAYLSATFTTWGSSDGRTWHISSQPGSSLLHWPALASDGTHIVMLGAAPSGSASVGAWVSTDGSTWTRLAFSGDATPPVPEPWVETGLNQLARDRVVWVARDGILVNGSSSGTYPREDAFWYGAAKSP
jgi:hypothetical protein